MAYTQVIETMKTPHKLRKVLTALVVLTTLNIQPSVANQTKNIVVYGASGRIGQVIVDEALTRGYKVTGVSRKPENLNFKHENFNARKGDLMDISSIRDTIDGADAVVISVSARAPDNRPENSLLVKVTENMLSALAQLENKPYILQIGSASLSYGSTYEEVKLNMHGVPFNFDEGSEMHAVLFGHQISVSMYRESQVDWTVIAPPKKILGIRGTIDNITSKGAYRSSVSKPLVDSQGENTIYVRDLARAALNEIEAKEFNRQVFAVGY